MERKPTFDILGAAAPATREKKDLEGEFWNNTMERLERQDAILLDEFEDVASEEKLLMQRWNTFLRIHWKGANARRSGTCRRQHTPIALGLASLDVGICKHTSTIVHSAQGESNTSHASRRREFGLITSGAVRS